VPLRGGQREGPARPGLRAEAHDAGRGPPVREGAARAASSRGVGRARGRGACGGFQAEARAREGREARRRGGPARRPRDAPGAAALGARLVSAEVREEDAPSLVAPEPEGKLLTAILGGAARFLKMPPLVDSPRAAVDVYNLFRHRNRSLDLDDFGWDPRAGE